ncbi:hypothetical protein [Enterococcus alishanensis]
MKKINKNVSAIEFLWLALYAFAGFSLELIQGLLGSFSQGISNLITAILWTAVSVGLIYLARTKFCFFILDNQPTLKKQNHWAALCCVGIVIVLTTFGFGGFKPWIEFTSVGSLANYLLRILYYLAESLLILLAIVFAQRFADLKFTLPEWLPAGGVFLAITWGLIHFFLQGFSGGLYAIAFSLLAGMLYLFLKKDFRWSYLYIALAFIL